MKRRIKRFFYKIKRVIDFIPIIWKGYDFDYYSSIELFKYQLKRTAEYLESDKAQTLEAKANATKIWTAVELMEKVYDEEYGTEYIDIIEKLYGKTHYDFVELEEKDEKGDPFYEIKICNDFAVDETHQKVIDEVRHQMFLLGKDKQKRAHKLLWSYIEHNILNWWD